MNADLAKISGRIEEIERDLVRERFEEVKAMEVVPAVSEASTILDRILFQNALAGKTLDKETMAYIVGKYVAIPSLERDVRDIDELQSHWRVCSRLWHFCRYLNGTYYSVPITPMHALTRSPRTCL